jgi:hypothetical protein
MDLFGSALKYCAGATTFRNHKDKFLDLYHEVWVPDVQACHVPRWNEPSSIELELAPNLFILNNF